MVNAKNYPNALVVETNYTYTYEWVKKPPWDNFTLFLYFIIFSFPFLFLSSLFSSPQMATTRSRWKKYQNPHLHQKEFNYSWNYCSRVLNVRGDGFAAVIIYLWLLIIALDKDIGGWFGDFHKKNHLPLLLFPFNCWKKIKHLCIKLD